MKTLYSDNKCDCGLVAVGHSTTGKIGKYYCNKHWWAMSKKVEEWITRQEVNVWGDQIWYKQAMEKKPTKTKQRQQNNQPK